MINKSTDKLANKLVDAFLKNKVKYFFNFFSKKFLNSEFL